MASRYWRGVSNDFTSTSNWSATRYGSTGEAAPASNDDVYFLDAVPNSPTTNLSQAAVDLNSLTVGPDYNGNIGAPGSPLVIAVSGTSGATLRFSGSGVCYLTAGTNGVDRAIINPRGSGKFVATGGTFAIVENVSGNNDVLSGATATTVYTFARLALQAGAACTTATVLRGGDLYSEVNLTTLNNKGSARLTRDATLTTLNNDGSYVHQSSGTITTANCYTGSQAVALCPFTVTTLNEYIGSTAFEEANVAVTVGTRNQIGW